MSAEQNRNAVPAKQRRIFFAQRCGGKLGYCTPVRTGGESRMMEEGDDVAIADAVQPVEL